MAGSVKQSSPVWLYFEKLRKNETFAKCKLCPGGKKVAARYGNTSNLTRHIETSHKTEAVQLKKALEEKASLKRKLKDEAVPSESPGTSSKQTKMVPFLQDKKWGSQDKRQRDCNKKLTEMICIDLQPVSIVNDQGFREFIHCLQPAYNIPNRKVIRDSLSPKAYMEQSSVIKSKLKDCVSLGITLDHWTSVAQDAYMAVTAHFLSDNFTISDYCLNVAHMPESHTAVNISEALLSCLDVWIPDYNERTLKIYVVTDNASNVQAAMRQLPSSKFVPLNCFAHTLQLAVNDAVKKFFGLEKVIAKAKVITKHFHASAKDTHSLAEKQKSLGVPVHRLKSECPTRWNSLYYLLERLVEQRESVTAVLATNDKINDLKKSEWKIAASYVSALKPFEDATNMMSASRYATSSMIIPVLHVLNEQMKDVEMNDFGKQIHANINARWPEYEMKLEFAIPTYLDPRFKNYGFNDDTARDRTAKEIVQLMLDNAKNPQVIETPSACESDIKKQSASATESSETATTSKKTVWEIFKKMVDKKKQTASEHSTDNLREKMEHELQLFCSEELLEPEKSPFDWWKTNKTRYSNLAKLAQVFLSIPATSVPSERMFSKSGLIISNRRSCLEPFFAEQLTFLGHNLRQ
ncbi:E3 SUMO-protein ligase ZBED1-like [Ylistrum balloti]|uniref:E3 SUMO-protein ligase ZBED1-like n=1 Tax=Ylistrum balloti TaxID=509963 RepID=UPI0029058F85|nr:E3 SUMO-protein ligase ZBED1-like [Ylistrum balloti]